MCTVLVVERNENTDDTVLKLGTQAQFSCRNKTGFYLKSWEWVVFSTDTHLVQTTVQKAVYPP